MKLFRQLLGKKAEPETIESQIKKLDDQPQAALEAIVVASEQDMEIRKSALARVTYGPFLEKLAVGSDHPAMLQKNARTKIAEMVDDGGLPVDKVLQSIKNTEALLAIASFCTKVDLQSPVLAGITDQQLLADLCLNASAASIRQDLANRVNDPALLKSLLKGLKQKDKVAYKIVKSKVDTIREEELKAAELAEKITELVNEMKLQMTRHVDKDYVQKVERLLRRWSDVSEQASGEQAESFLSGLKACREKIQAYEDEIKAEEEFNHKVSGAKSQREAILREIWTIIETIYATEAANDEGLSQHAEALDTLKQQWKELKQYGNPSSADAKDYTHMTDAVTALLNSYADKGTLLAHYAIVLQDDADQDLHKAAVKHLKSLLYPIQNLTAYETPNSVELVLATLARLDADYASSQEERQKKIRQIGGMLKKSAAAADQGRLRQAIGIRHSINEKVEELESLPANISRQIEELDTAIQKLVDWQSYAVVPKKQELVAAMEKLVGLDEPPEALATKIKRLQDEWKLLSQSGKDRQEELWQKFSELADQAYEPCKVYYQELGEKRKENLEKRQKLVQQLQDFHRDYDWENADWKYVESILNTARPELHSYAPVDRAANKPVLSAFDAVMTSLRDKVNGELDNNKAAKERLIAQAEQLVEMADLQQAIDGAKRLQLQWKSIGRCHYRDNEKLWKAFRVHCDAVFEKKQQQYEAQKAEVDSIIADAKAILAKVVAMKALSEEELLATRTERDELQSAFAAIEGLPEKVQRGIERDLRKAIDDIETKLTKAKQNSKNQAWVTYFDACEKINSYHMTVQQQPENAEELKAQLESFTASVSRWPEGCQSIIKQSIAAQDESCADENLKKLRLLCIRAEILAEKSTPQEDKALRMEYQVNMLKKGIGAVIQEDNIVENLAREWGSVGPVDMAQYGSLYKRFYESWSHVFTS